MTHPSSPAGTERLAADRALIERTLAEPNAYAAIIERFETPLRRYLRRFLWGAADVDDVLQETFISAYRNLRDVDPELGLSGWMYRIAHNAAMTQLRRAGIRRAVSLDEDAIDPDGQTLIDRIAGDTDVAGEVWSKRTGDLVRSALRELRPEDREILSLRFLEEKSYEEIGDILRLPGGTVATRISRAKSRLRELIERRGLADLAFLS